MKIRLSLGGLLLAFSAAAQKTPSAYEVGSNVQVSVSRSALRHYEAYAAADPRIPGHLMACAYVLRDQDHIDNIFYVSWDRGQTWHNTLTVPDAVDPSCGFDQRGVAFAGNIHDQPFPDGKTDSVLAVYRSQDGGHNWSPAPVSAETRGIDRAYVTADHDVYAHGYRATRKPAATFLFLPSTDQGHSFDRVMAIEATHFAKPWYFPGNGVFDRDGNFYSLIAELDDTKRNMSFRTDADSAPPVNAVLNMYVLRPGGKTIAAAGRISDVCYDSRIPQLSMPGLAVDRSHSRYAGRLYAVWPDARFDRRTQILLSYSSDQGRTWTAPRAISEDLEEHAANPRANQFMPAVAVNPDGVLGISWYDRHEQPDNLGYTVRFAASLDGGATWLPSTAVSSVPHKASDDSRKNSGDTAGLAADAGGLFHPVWIDNRTGSPQMWTAAVKVRGQVPRR